MERKTTYEQVIDFLETHNGKLMKGSFYESGNPRPLKKDKLTEEQLKEECLQNSTPIEEEAIKKYIPKDIRDIYKDKLEQGNIQTCLEILYLTDRVLKNKHNNQEKIKTLKINITK